jgi:hypothetical protein
MIEQETREKVRKALKGKKFLVWQVLMGFRWYGRGEETV